MSQKKLKPLTGLFLLLMPFFSHAADDEDCIFDQQQQVIEYKKLLQKFPGSRYLEQEHKLVIPDGNSEVHLSRGGCVHYGVMIELLETSSGQTNNDAQFFQQIIAWQQNMQTKISIRLN